MTKKKHPISVRLPMPVIRAIEKIADMADEKPSTIINVILALAIFKEEKTK